MNPVQLCEEEGKYRNRKMGVMLAVSPVVWEFYRLAGQLQSRKESQAEVTNVMVDHRLD